MARIIEQKGVIEDKPFEAFELGITNCPPLRFKGFVYAQATGKNHLYIVYKTESGTFVGIKKNNKTGKSDYFPFYKGLGALYVIVDYFGYGPEAMELYHNMKLDIYEEIV